MSESFICGHCWKEKPLENYCGKLGHRKVCQKCMDSRNAAMKERQKRMKPETRVTRGTSLSS